MAYFGQLTIAGRIVCAKPKKSKPLILWIHITCIWKQLKTYMGDLTELILCSPGLKFKTYQNKRNYSHYSLFK